MSDNILDLKLSSNSILHLIQHHLTECGLHESSKALLRESGVGAVGVFTNLAHLAKIGSWGQLLSLLQRLDSTVLTNALLAQVYEMTVLELGEAGEMDLARATLRLADEVLSVEVVHSGGISTGTGSLVDELEAKLQTLESSSKKYDAAAKISRSLLPDNYYGGEGIVTKQQRRDKIGEQLDAVISRAPPSRLVTLLQQSIKWQAHTGQIPVVNSNESYLGDKNEESNDLDEEILEEEVVVKGKKKKRSRRVVAYDIALGESSFTKKLRQQQQHSANVAGGGDVRSLIQKEKYPSKEFSTIKFGKRVHPEVAIFLPDGSGIVTGSSDGFIEVWDSKRGKLRMDLEYQKNDEMMLHDTAVLALSCSNDGDMLASGSVDGMIRVWQISTGKCLRQVEKAHSGAISCLCFNRDATHILSGSHDTLLREFGLRSGKILREFRGHNSYINTCAYFDSYSCIISGSSDGFVKLFDLKSSEVKFSINPAATAASSLATSSISGIESQGGVTTLSSGGGILSVLPLHTSSNLFVAVPRGRAAFLVSSKSGQVIRQFDCGSENFVAAAISPYSDRLYCINNQHSLECFEVSTTSGKRKDNIAQLVAKSDDDDESKARTTEILGLSHHPHQSVLACLIKNEGSRGFIKLLK